MKLQGEHHLPAPRDEVWKALLDPEVLSKTVPGSEGLEQTGENEFSGRLKMKIGPVQGVFQGKVELTDLRPPNGYKMKIEGRGPVGFVNATGDLTLTEDAEGTLLAYEVDAQVGGRIASVGQRLVESSAKVITRQALAALQEQIEARVGPASAAGSENGAVTTPVSPPAASNAKMAAGFAGGLLNELLPKGAGRWALVAGLLALSVVLIVWVWN